MGCKVGYPNEPCPFGHDGKVTRAACGRCPNYDPPAWLKSWCAVYDQSRTVCTLPKSSCESCPSKVERGPGRPPGEGKFDYRSPTDVKKAQAEYRARNATREQKRGAKWRAEHPDYYKDYRARNRDKLNKQRRERYAKRKRQRDDD